MADAKRESFREGTQVHTSGGHDADVTGDGICRNGFDGTGDLQFSGNHRDAEPRIGRHLKRKRLTGPDALALPAVAELNLRDREQLRTVIDLDLVTVELALPGGGPLNVNVHHAGSSGGDGDGTAYAPFDLDAWRPPHLIMACKGVAEGVVGDQANLSPYAGHESGY